MRRTVKRTKHRVLKENNFKNYTSKSSSVDSRIDSSVLLDLAFIISQTYFNDTSHSFVSFFKVHFLKIKYFCIDILVLDKTCTYFSVPTIIVFTIFNFPRTWLLPATNNKSRCCSQISFSIFHKLNRGSNSTVNWGRFGSVILIFF